MLIVNFYYYGCHYRPMWRLSKIKLQRNLTKVSNYRDCSLLYRSAIIVWCCSWRCMVSVYDLWVYSWYRAILFIAIGVRCNQSWKSNQNYNILITIYQNHTDLLYNEILFIASHVYIILISYTTKLSYRKIER
jgi:hypothetical protein